MILIVSVIICVIVILMLIIYCSFLNWIEHLYSALSGKGFKGNKLELCSKLINLSFL